MSSENALKRNIMRRVYFIWLARKAANPLFLKIAVLTALFLACNATVSVKNILINMPDMAHVGKISRFYWAAFLRTELTVQLLILAAIIIVALLIKDTVLKLSLFKSSEKPA